ncbi:hypothetical protein [Methylicorpusculum sp.]|uniref:hypothetical protein n=1 Tax=Methylicorpusculum sp. TaxID=2713644 RepID=UPI0027233573|nr:hypothetical protein [Methylicorpusculum sp.]MDO8846228.1 hypothetical protein [Methylicorpusculum sp.]
MNDEELYLEATCEVEGENKSAALWAKVMALSEGDSDKAKYKYIKLRVEQLKTSKKERNPVFTKKTVNEFDLKYMPLSEFSRIKSIPPYKVLDMIRDGFYIGYIKDNQWYVSRNEVGKADIVKNISPRQKTSHSKEEYIPIEEFAEFKGITTEKAIAMIRDGFYQGRIMNDRWFVHYSEVEQTTQSIQPSTGGFFSKLANGDFGLAKTYWLYGVLVSFIITNILVKVITSISALVTFMIIFTAYQIPVNMGIWRASDKYQGPNVWAMLAKIGVVLSCIVVAIGFFAIAGLLKHA